MPQNFITVPGQAVGAPGLCVLSWQDPAGLANVAVSFLPTLVKIVQHQFTPLQKVNLSINGTVHVFQFGTQEPLRWQLEFVDLPYNTLFSRAIGHPTQGFEDLLSFVRTTLNYSEKVFTVVAPDGQVEQMRYLNGIEQFREAAGQTNKLGFWTGTLAVTRIIP